MIFQVLKIGQKIAGALHEDLPTFMTALVTSITMVAFDNKP
jgi:hypothetical protein